MKKLIILLTLAMLLVLSPPSMATNDITGKTWVLDTTGSITTNPTQIVWLIWTGIGTDLDVLEIHDASGGSLIVKLEGKEGIDMIVPFPGNSGLLPGMYLTTIDSGEVLVRTGRN